MTPTTRFLMLSRVTSIAFLVVIIFFAGSIFGQGSVLTITAQDVTVHPDDTDAALIISMTNTIDSVAGFVVWLVADQPDVIQFTGEVDTIGTLINAIDQVLSNSLGGEYFDMRVVALPDLLQPTIGILPQDNGTLFRLPFNIFQNPTPGQPYDVEVFFAEIHQFLNFSDPNGQSIGTSIGTLLETDTAYFVCNQWIGTDCVLWQQVSGPSFDSIAIGPDYYAYYDPEIVEINNATITILPYDPPDPELIVTAHDISLPAAAGEGVLTISMSNLVDTVAGFELWLMLDQPDVIQFTGEIDTVSTLLSDWQVILTNSLGGQFYDLKVVALANDFANPIYNSGTPPQENGTLYRLPFDILQNPTPDVPYDVQVQIIEPLDHFGFSDPNGNLIGISYDTVFDTAFYICTNWVGEECLDWQRVFGPPYDSIWVDSSQLVPRLDTNLVKIHNGTITILPDCVPIVPGDVDGDGVYNISDLPLLISFIYHGLPVLFAPWNGDVDGNCILNWDDVNLLEAGGPYAECTCYDPQWVCCRGLTGNANYDRFDDALVDDLTYLVNYLFKGGPEPPCIGETLINPYTDNTTPLVSDLTHMVNYLFKGGELPDVCLGQ